MEGTQKNEEEEKEEWLVGSGGPKEKSIFQDNNIKLIPRELSLGKLCPRVAGWSGLSQPERNGMTTESGTLNWMDEKEMKSFTTFIKNKFPAKGPVISNSTTAQRSRTESLLIVSS